MTVVQVSSEAPTCFATRRLATSSKTIMARPLRNTTRLGTARAAKPPMYNSLGTSRRVSIQVDHESPLSRLNQGLRGLHGSTSSDHVRSQYRDVDGLTRRERNQYSVCGLHSMSRELRCNAPCDARSSGYDYLRYRDRGCRIRKKKFDRAVRSCTYFTPAQHRE